MSVFDEIVVEGLRPRARPPRPPTIAPRTITGGVVSPTGTREDFVPPPRRRPPEVDIVPPTTGRAPPVPPVLLPEIVVRGTPTTRPPFGFGPAAKVNFATLFAVVGGLLVSEILRERSQAMLDAEFAELMRQRRRRPDSPLVVQPQTIPEVIVTGRAPNIPRIAPLPPPFISPDFVPDEMIPFTPRPLFEPDAAPPIPLPAIDIPMPAPFRVSPQRSPISVPTRQPSISPQIEPTRRTLPQPQTLPSTRPATDPRVAPLPVPLVSPTPSVQPTVFPQFETRRLTDFRRRLAQSLRRETQRRSLVEAQAQQLARREQCPPCPKRKKDEEESKERTECYKQLVKQARFPEDDITFDWVRINCDTGREMKPGELSIPTR